jgi:hypothetical protein
MLYVGQTFNLESRSYCGSGQYWVAHCKKHGGYGRKNIEVTQKFWAENEAGAQRWLDEFELSNPGYFDRDNSKWANRARETTGNSAFCGVTKEKRKEYARTGGLAVAKVPNRMSEMAAIQGRANADSGHMQSIQKIGCSLGGKVAGKKTGRLAVTNGQLAKAAVLGGRAVSLARHEAKDAATGKSSFAVRLGKASGATRALMAKFCKESGVLNPGTNYVNMDKQAFQKWRESHVG